MAMALSDELAEEILLRLPPDDPGSLVRAGLSCKRALRLAADPGFRRRYRAFHGAAPMLGFLHNTKGARGSRRGMFGFLEEPPTVARFVPNLAASSSSCLPSGEVRDCRVLDARHGRALLCIGLASRDSRLVVWDPVTDERCVLPLMPVTLYRANWNAAVLCTAAGCDHLDCHGNRFTVVFVAIDEIKVLDYTYSTEDLMWSWPHNPGAHQHDGHLNLEPSALVGDALYFVLQPGNKILEYNVGTRKVAVIQPPRGCFPGQRVVLMAAEDDGLGIATVLKSKLYIWSREIGSDEDAGWAPRRVINLKMLLPVRSPSSPVVSGYAYGVGIIFVRTSGWFFMIDLKSSRVKRIRNVIGGSSIFPYMSFWNPALGGTSTGDGSRGAASALRRCSGSQVGDKGSDDDDEATASDKDDDDNEAMGSDDHDDEDSVAMVSGDDDDEEEEGGFTNLASLFLLVLGELS